VTAGCADHEGEHGDPAEEEDDDDDDDDDDDAK